MKIWQSIGALVTVVSGGVGVEGFASPFSPSRAFVLSSRETGRETTTRRQMISFGGMGGTKEAELEQLPRDVKDAISKCRGAVQKGLEGRLSRMDVEMPVGADFGVENKKGKGGSKNKKGNLEALTGEDELGMSSEDIALTMEKLETSDRELARLFVEMFQPLGGQHICAVFNNENMADQAQTKWANDVSAECKVVAIDRKGKKSRGGVLRKSDKAKKKKKKAMGFASKMASELDEKGSERLSGPFSLPAGTEVALFVAPGPKELIIVERICNEVGMESCIVLLNARLSPDDTFATDDARDLFMNGFEKVFHLGAAPQDVAPGCLEHRAYPGEWVLARKPKVGAPKTIATQKEQFTPEECRTAFENVELTDFEKGTEKLAQNVATWFK